MKQGVRYKSSVGAQRPGKVFWELCFIPFPTKAAARKRRKQERVLQDIETATIALHRDNTANPFL